jgi:hypothetical protein
MPSVTAASTPIVTLYTRAGCSLCDESRATLHALRDERAASDLPTFDLVERDISVDPELDARYGSLIPVVELGERRLELAVSAGRLRRLLADGLGDPGLTAIPR